MTVALVLSVGALAVEACVAPEGGAPGGEDAGGFDGFPVGPGQDGSPPVSDAAIDATTKADANAPPVDSSIADTSTPLDAGEKEAAADAQQDTSVPVDSSQPDGADSATPPDSAGVADSAADAADSAADSATDAADSAADAADSAADAADAGPTFTHYVFMEGEGEVESFGIDLTSGSLTAISQKAVDGGSTFQSTSGGAIGAAFTPNNDYLYVVEDPFGVAAYQVEHGGLLSRIDAGTADAAAPLDFPAGSGCRSVVATSSYVFTANEVGTSISRFSIGAGGFLTALGDVALPAGDQPKGLAVDPTGTFLFGFNYLLGTITVFKIGGAGALTPVIQDPEAGVQDFVTPGGYPFAGVVHPTLRTLYVTSGSQSNVLLPLAYDANGVLSVIGSPTISGLDGGANPSSFGLALDPAGKFLYVVNYEVSFINIYAVDGTTGAITPAGTAVSPTSLRAVSVDPSGGFLFVGGDTGSLAGYGITSGTGALTALGQTSSPLAGYTDPIGIVP